MALPDLTGQNIENTYQRIVQTDGTNFYDGTGSVVNFGVDPFPYTGSAVITGSLNIIGQFTASGFNYPTIAGNEGEAIVINQDGNLQFAYPKAITERVKNVSGGPLLKGVPVHATGSGTSGNIVGVIAADAGVPAKMPATYVLNEDLANGAEGEALAVGYIQGVNTTGLIEGEVVYVAVGGGWTQTKPTGSALIQNLGVVTKVGTNGSGVVLGAGRSNDLPNIKAGSFWVGNANGVPTAVATSSFISVSQTSSFAKLNSDNTFTGENQFNNTTIFSSNIALAANINLENDLTYSLGGDSTRDHWFATASIGHIRTFENTIEFYDEVTRSPKAALKIQDQNFILEKSDGTKTSMSGSSADFTGNVRASSFFGNGSNLTGINTGSWNGIFTGSAVISGGLDVDGPTNIEGNLIISGASSQIILISESAQNANCLIYNNGDSLFLHAALGSGKEINMGGNLRIWDPSNASVLNGYFSFNSPPNDNRPHVTIARRNNSAYPGLAITNRTPTAPSIRTETGIQITGSSLFTGSLTIIGSTQITGSLGVTGSFRGSVIDITPSNQTASLNCSLGNFFTLTLSSSVNTFLTASNIQAGQSINLRIIQPATSGSLSYGSEFKFPNGLPYTASATSSVTDILSFITFDSTTLYGSSLKNFI